MTGDTELEVPVVVVGAGPAGLMTSLLLSRYGVSSMIVERQAGVSPLPRAMGINVRTMEIFRGLGLDADVEAIGVDVGDSPFLVELDTLRGPVRETVPRGGATDLGGPGSPTPAHFAFCAQNRLEPMLLDKLAASGLCEVRRGTELIGLSQDAYGVTANVRDRSHNTERSVRAAYLVGADGAYSTIRAQLGIAMRGHDHLTRELNILFDADLRSVLGKVRAILYHVRHPWLPAPCQFRNTDGGSRWSLLSHYFEDPSHERCGELVRLCAVDPELKVEILAVGEWERAALLADHFREGRVFLTGDAVHRVTPAGAFGMNTAIQTAHNLAWKLAAVLRGWAGPGLLDTYEAERRPWTGQTVDLSYRLQAQHEQAGQSTEAALRAALIGRGIVEPGDLEASVTGYRDGSAARARVAQQAARRPDLEGALETRRRAEVVAADAARRHQQAGQALGEAAREQRLEADDPSSALSALVQWEAANRERMEKARRQVSARAELDTLLAGGTYDELLREADQERRRAEAAMADLPQDGVDTEAALPDLEARLSDARANAQAAQVAAAAARGELKQLSAAPANVSECEEAFVAAQAELQRVRRLDVTLTMTREFLERAQERVHRDIAPVLEQTLREWLPLVTAGRYTDASVDPESLEVKVKDGVGKFREAGLVSQGTREQIYLLLRVALVTHLTKPGEVSPLIFDDVTVQTDSIRTQAILDLLHEMSAERQVIVFSQEEDVRRWADANLDPARDRMVVLSEGVQAATTRTGQAT